MVNCETINKSCVTRANLITGTLHSILLIIKYLNYGKQSKN